MEYKEARVYRVLVKCMLKLENKYTVAAAVTNSVKYSKQPASDKGCLIRPLRYERVYLPLCKVADAPFHI